MANTFKNIITHTHQGRRAYQEDSFAQGEQFILVSDGVGGLSKGDIASDIVKSVWQEAFEQQQITQEDLVEGVQRCVQKTIAALNTYAKSNPESSGMGATLACVALIGEQVVSIHIGDSRVYHFSKDGSIKWRSTDHSLVQELVTGGIITEEEALTHPRRNVITRVLQAKEDHVTKAAIHILENVESSDRFMVCSDGITESWADAGLSSVVFGNPTTTNIIKEIGSHSAANSGDNNTAVIAEIELDIMSEQLQNIHDVSVAAPKEVKREDIAELEMKDNGQQSDHNPLSLSEKIQEVQPEKVKLKKKMKLVRWAAIGMLGIMLLFLMTRSCTPTKIETTTKEDIGNRKPIKEGATQIPGKKILDSGKSSSENPLNNKTDIQVNSNEITKKQKQNDILIVEDLVQMNEDSLYKQYNTLKNVINAKMYLKHFPNGKYHQEIENALKNYEKTRKVQKDTSNQGKKTTDVMNK